MAIDYTQQKLWEAVNSLIGTGTLQERLKYAAVAIGLLRVHAPAFPTFPELEERLARLIERVSDSPMRGLSDEDAEKVASEILSLFCEATRAATYPVGASQTVIGPSDVH